MITSVSKILQRNRSQSPQDDLGSRKSLVGAASRVNSQTELYQEPNKIVSLRPSDGRSFTNDATPPISLRIPQSGNGSSIFSGKETHDAYPRGQNQTQQLSAKG